MTFNIYVASYHRANETKVHKLLEYCTYVVRESEAEAYRNAGIESVWGIPDEKINSFGKVQNYIIENAPEDIVCVLDDDIEAFAYCLEKCEDIKDIVTPTRELERWGQLMADLDIGLAGSRIVIALPYGYTGELNFQAMIGPIRFYNRAKVKARYVMIQFFSDTDFVLQELLENRIILRPNYFGGRAKIETNKGGMNTRRTKKVQEDCFNNYMKPKWGKYVNFDTKKNITIISVRR